MNKYIFPATILCLVLLVVSCKGNGKINHNAAPPFVLLISIDEVFVKINGEQFYLWRAIDQEGEVLEAYVSKRRNKAAALKFLGKLLRWYGNPDEIVTDRCPSYGATLRDLNMESRQRTRQYLNNPCELSHQPFRRRERAIQQFKRWSTLQKFATIQSSIYNHFNQERHIYSRDYFKQNREAALAEWRGLYAG